MCVSGYVCVCERDTERQRNQSRKQLEGFFGEENGNKMKQSTNNIVQYTKKKSNRQIVIIFIQNLDICVK